MAPEIKTTNLSIDSDLLEKLCKEGTVADELGTAREVVSRLLKQLEKDKKVALSRNKIKILKPM